MGASCQHIVVPILLAILSALVAVPVSADLQISGDLAINARFGDQNSNINSNFRGDDPFNTVRARLFVRNWVTQDVGIFTEFLFDTDADARLNGAYVVFNNVIKDRLNLKVGMMPSPFGNYGLRSSYFNLNPVVGVPLMWQYKTAMVRSPVVDQTGALVDTNATLLDRRDNIADRRGSTPIAYDACWETGVELSGNGGMFEYTFAVTDASLSNPTLAADNEGYQGIVKLGVAPIPGLRTGLSAALGDYLYPGSTAASIELEDFEQRVIGWYGEYLVGKVELFGEWVRSTWEVPGLRGGDLYADSGYVDVKWHAKPALSIGLRLDYMDFSQIVDTRTASEQSQKWDIPLRRVETALGWRFRREGLVRLVYQGTRFDQGRREDVDLVALQLHMVF